MRLIAVILSAALVCPRTGIAQQPAAPAAQPAPVATQPATPQVAGQLKINVIRGNDSQNNIRSRTAAQPGVEIRDEENKAIPGAEVVFELPYGGPGGTFNEWLRIQTVRTNSEGQAFASGFTPNDQEGKFQIKVTASAAGKQASAVITQTNVRPAGGGAAASDGSRSKWVVLGILGAGALAGGIYAGTRNGNGGAATPLNPIVISAGPITVGGPR